MSNPRPKEKDLLLFQTKPWDDIGALREILDEFQVSILGPVQCAEAFQSLGICNPIGVLLCGRPGCDKILLAKAVANDDEINLVSVKGPKLLNLINSPGRVVNLLLTEMEGGEGHLGVYITAGTTATSTTGIQFIKKD